MTVKRFADQPGIVDCLFLFGTILLSSVPYLARLGFYSDDWGYQAALAPTSGQSLGTMFNALLASDANLLIRPVQAALLALEFKTFGRHPLPYHIACTVMLGLVSILLYFLLTELRAGRLLGLVIALVFGLLPHYSTDRIWISSQQAVLSMAFALLGICGLMRSVRPEVQRPSAWVAFGALALVLSFLSYEVAAGLIFATVGVIAWRRYHELTRHRKRTLAGLTGLACATAVLFVVGILKIRMQTRMSYHHHFFTHLGALIWHAIIQAVQFNFWTYGLHMPAVLAALYRQSALSVIAFGSAATITCLVAAYLLREVGSREIPSRRTCLWLMILGFVLFGLGFALFFPSLDVDFSSVGTSNRIAIVSALGACCTLIAIVGLACSVLTTQRARARAFSLAIGVFCGMNSLVVSGIGSYWGKATAQQSAILRSVSTNVRSLPRKSVLLLDGFCRYSGPGVVFETDWDATGAIRLTLGDDSLVSDVVSSNLHFEEAAAATTMYGNAEGHYPYGNNLFVYNVRNETLTSLPSQETAIDYLRTMNPTGDSGCPPAHEGRGEKTF